MPGRAREGCCFLPFACGQAGAVTVIYAREASAQIANLGGAYDILKLRGAQLQTVALAESIETVFQVVILPGSGSSLVFPRSQNRSVAITQGIKARREILNVPGVCHDLTLGGRKLTFMTLADAGEAVLEITIASGAFGERAFRPAQSRGIAGRETIETIREVVVEADFVDGSALVGT